MKLPAPSLLVSDDWRDYALLDSGDGRKLERFGAVIVDRPDAQALWRPQIDRTEWRANAVFDASNDEDERGRWSYPGAPPPDRWTVSWEGLQLEARCAAFRHMGLFPEHSVHWRWAMERIAGASRPVRLLNLFGYTGAMSLAAASVGADVVHLDASAKSIAQGRENQGRSGLSDRPIHWICDDAMKFVEREIRRGRTYDAIVLDPPKFGRGPKNEVWRFEEDFAVLLDRVRELVSDKPLFVVATVYAVRLSHVAVAQALIGSLSQLRPRLSHGEMGIHETARGWTLPTGLYARAEWS